MPLLLRLGIGLGRVPLLPLLEGEPLTLHRGHVLAPPQREAQPAAGGERAAQPQVAEARHAGVEASGERTREAWRRWETPSHWQ